MICCSGLLPRGLVLASAAMAAAEAVAAAAAAMGDAVEDPVEAAAAMAAAAAAAKAVRARGLLRRQRCHADAVGAARVPAAAEWTGAEVRRLELELQSLREVYARKLADTELRCERQLQAKDDERESWFRERKADIAKIRAGVVVMQAIFQRKRHRFVKQMTEERESFESMKESFSAELERLQAAADTVRENCKRDMAAQAQAYEEQIDSQKRKTQDAADLVRRLQEELERLRQQNRRLVEEGEIKRAEAEELRAKLTESERREEEARRSTQVEALEAELRRTKKLIQEQRHSEAEALRKELMEYVKFIVHILPEDKAGAATDEAFEALSGKTPMSPRLSTGRRANATSPSQLPPLNAPGRQPSYGRSSTTSACRQSITAASCYGMVTPLPHSARQHRPRADT